MFYKVKEVKPLSDYHLLVRFMNGETKQYDTKPHFAEWDAYLSLQNIQGLFEQVHVDAHGYGIAWNDDIDLDCNTLYEYGESVTV
ncbi:hypothetical protein FACS1894190_03860 [Spirochaetia bacterium]|nr:hypothetical protein FACS1894190_03860 [Spirochaetia bacterium]